MRESVELLVALAGRKFEFDVHGRPTLSGITFAELPSLGLTVDETRISSYYPKSWADYKRLGMRAMNSGTEWYGLPVIPLPLPSSNSPSESVSLTHEP